MEDLINQWKEDRQRMTGAGSADELIRTARQQDRNILNAHYGTLLILCGTLIVLALYFYNYRYATAAGITGMWLMLGGLVLRIFIETISVLQYQRVRPEESLAHSTNRALAFHRFRKRIHGPFTLGIVALYVAGFYLAATEFNRYLPTALLAWIHFSFPVVVIVLVRVIRTGIRKEMESLEQMMALSKEIEGR